MQLVGGSICFSEMGRVRLHRSLRSCSTLCPELKAQNSKSGLLTNEINISSALIIWLFYWVFWIPDLVFWDYYRLILNLSLFFCSSLFPFVCFLFFICKLRAKTDHLGHVKCARFPALTQKLFAFFMNISLRTHFYLFNHIFILRTLYYKKSVLIIILNNISNNLLFKHAITWKQVVRYFDALEINLLFSYNTPKKLLSSVISEGLMLESSNFNVCLGYTLFLLYLYTLICLYHQYIF